MTFSSIRVRYSAIFCSLAIFVVVSSIMNFRLITSAEEGLLRFGSQYNPAISAVINADRDLYQANVAQLNALLNSNDSTYDTGTKNAILAEVLRPDSSVKAKWFDVVINNPDQLKLSTLRYIMWGLFPREQKSFEQPYVERILAHVDQLNAQGELRMLKSFVSTMIPTDCTKSSHQRLTNLVEQNQGMKPQVVKAIKATHQNVGRCVAVLEKLK